MWLAALSLVACLGEDDLADPWAVDGNELEWGVASDGVRPPPPGPIAITVTGMAPTETATVTVTGLGAGDDVVVAASRNGISIGAFCPPTFGGHCIDLVPNVGKVARGTADAGGTFVAPWKVPLMVAPGETISFQAIYPDLGSPVLSPAIDVVAAESACPTNGVTSAPFCPAACTGGCDGGTCNILCDDTSECQVTTLNCPDDMNCHVTCSGLSSCQVSTINCPDGGYCDIDCSFTSTCQVATINGGDGGMDLRCSGVSSCQLSNVTCGTGPCDLTCDGISASVSSADCGPSCDCDAGGC